MPANANCTGVLPIFTVENAPDVTDTPVTSDLEKWLKSLDSGKIETVVTSEGSRYSFNNDGKSHYLEFIDVTRKEPNGRSKRVYKGKIEGGHVSYKGVTSALECATEYARWVKTPYGRKGRENTGNSSPPDGRDEQLALQDRREDARPFYLQ